MNAALDVSHALGEPGAARQHHLHPSLLGGGRANPEQVEERRRRLELAGHLGADQLEPAHPLEGLLRQGPSLERPPQGVLGARAGKGLIDHRRLARRFR